MPKACRSSAEDFKLGTCGDTENGLQVSERLEVKGELSTQGKVMGA